jgi:hypothetical protein
MRFLERRGERSKQSSATLFARRLESLLNGRPDQLDHVTEDELDAAAGAAWDWFERDGRDGIPERVLVLLDAVRARHAHD